MWYSVGFFDFRFCGVNKLGRVMAWCQVVSRVLQMVKTFFVTVSGQILVPWIKSITFFFQFQSLAKAYQSFSRPLNSIVSFVNELLLRRKRKNSIVSCVSELLIRRKRKNSIVSFVSQLLLRRRKDIMLNMKIWQEGKKFKKNHFAASRCQEE